MDMIWIHDMDAIWIYDMIYDMDIRYGYMIWTRYGHDMALRMDPTPRSSTGATQNDSPDGSNATILDRGHSKRPGAQPWAQRGRSRRRSLWRLYCGTLEYLH